MPGNHPETWIYTNPMECGVLGMHLGLEGPSEEFKNIQSECERERGVYEETGDLRGGKDLSVSRKAAPGNR